MYFSSLYYVLFVLLFEFHGSLGTSCSGGSIVRSQLYGSPQDDSLISLHLDDTGILKLAGQTYNGTWTGNSINASQQPDYWVGVVDGETVAFSLEDAGIETMFNADVSSPNLCVVGSSMSVDFLAVWRNGSAILQSTPSWTYSGSGINYDAAKAVVCTETVVYLVSAIDNVGDGTTDIVVKSFSINGTAGVSGTYAGTDVDVGNDAALKNGILVVVGFSLSAGFPVSSGAFQATKAAGRDAVIFAINTTDFTTIFSTFYGGNGEDYSYGVAIDDNGYIFVCGSTSSSDLVLPNAYSTTSAGITDAWIAIFSPSGALVTASLFGSDGNDQGKDIALLNVYDKGHLIYLTGSTDGTNFPLQDNFVGTSGGNDAFILTYRIAADCMSFVVESTNCADTTGSLTFSTRYGGSGDDLAQSISIRTDGVIVIGGSTASSDFPATNGTYQGLSDAFYTVLNCPALIPVAPQPSPSASPAVATCQTTDGCYQASDIAVQFSDSATGTGYVPSLTVYPTDISGSVNTATALGVNYNRMEERDTLNNVVAQQEFPTSGYQLAVTSEDVGGTPVTVVTFSTTLSTGTNITIINYLFEQDTTFTFADTSFPVAASSTKSNIRIDGWPFQSTQNTFHLHLDLDIYPQPAPATASVDGDITNYNFDTGVSSCQVSVLGLAVIDEGSTGVTASVTASNIQVNFPYFSNSVLYDPGYTVLVNKGDQQSSSPKEPVSQWYYIGAAIGVAVISVIIAGFLLTFMKKKRNRQRAQTRAAIKHATEQMNSTASVSEVSTV